MRDFLIIFCIIFGTLFLGFCIGVYAMEQMQDEICEQYVEDLI